MNKFLADTVAFLNALFAVLIVLICVGAGYVFGYQYQQILAGLIAGGVIGFTFAILVCGTLALFVDIRNEMQKSRKLLEYIKANGIPANIFSQPVI